MRTLAASAVPVIAIDGPTASGKGTVSKMVARALGFAYLDSGSLYRIVGLLGLETGIDLDDGPQLAKVAFALDPAFRHDRIELAGRDITDEIRREDVGQAASRVAAVPELRAALLDLQHRQRRAPGLVADGRDMGTVVFPDARLKVFLQADVEVRAARRLKQLIEKGYSAKLTDLLQSLRERDLRDVSRDCAPLAAAEDAKVLDSTALTPEEVVAQVLEWYRQT